MMPTMKAGDEEIALTRAQARELDRRAAAEYGMSGQLLMEHAGLGAAIQVDSRYGRVPGGVAVLCGPGNNGGDGYVLARCLCARNHEVEVYELAAERPSPETSWNRLLVQRLGLPLHDLSASSVSALLGVDLARFGLLVDALLGTGFCGTPRLPLATVITAVNRVRTQQGTPVVALDLPSGLDADLGAASQPTIQADWTLTFAAWKTGFRQASARNWTGEISVVPIGTPPALLLSVAQGAAPP